MRNAFLAGAFEWLRHWAGACPRHRWRRGSILLPQRELTNSPAHYTLHAGFSLSLARARDDDDEGDDCCVCVRASELTRELQSFCAAITPFAYSPLWVYAQLVSLHNVWAWSVLWFSGFFHTGFMLSGTGEISMPVNLMAFLQVWVTNHQSV